MVPILFFTKEKISKEGQFTQFVIIIKLTLKPDPDPGQMYNSGSSQIPRLRLRNPGCHSGFIQCCGCGTLRIRIILLGPSGQCFGSGFFSGSGSNFFLESRSGSAENSDPEKSGSGSMKKKRHKTVSTSRIFVYFIFRPFNFNTVLFW